MKKLQLLLTTPCTESWDAMRPTKAGRYCDTCTKHIVDLTAKSDQEILDFFKRKKENVCARLSTSQLHRDLVVSPHKLSWQWLFPLALGASCVTPSNVSAQNKPTIIQNTKSLAPTKSYLEKKPKVDTIRGKVVDKNTGEPLADVHIVRKGYKNLLAKTDVNGNYALSMEIENWIYPLVFSRGEYHIAEQNVSSNMVVKLTKAPRIMLGGAKVVSIDNQPLYVISAGKKSCTLKKESGLQDINPDWIENIEILKGAEATAIYGSKASKGVIKIALKQEYYNKLNFLKRSKLAND